MVELMFGESPFSEQFGKYINICEQLHPLLYTPVEEPEPITSGLNYDKFCAFFEGEVTPDNIDAIKAFR